MAFNLFTAVPVINQNEHIITGSELATPTQNGFKNARFCKRGTAIPFDIIPVDYYGNGEQEYLFGEVTNVGPLHASAKIQWDADFRVTRSAHIWELTPAEAIEQGLSLALWEVSITNDGSFHNGSEDITKLLWLTMWN